MKIVYIAAGAGGMYCGACLHDNTLAAALLDLGEDVLLVPTYTPLRTDERDVSMSRMFFGGINVYLQQKSALFRHTPRIVDAVLDSPALISAAARHAGAVDASQLGDLVVSMLRGEEGRQRKELSRLVEWIAGEIKPDVVHLTNAMFVAMAREIRRRSGAPVVCGLAGEDVFLERMSEPHYSQARALLAERAADVDAFVAMNRYYADFMIDYMRLDPAKVHVIHHGLDLKGHGTRRRPPGEAAIRIGFFARICPDKGLHHLVEAFHLLCQDPSLPPIRLEAAGYMAPEDRPYLKELETRLAGVMDRAEKIAFLESLDMLSVPTVYRESKGLSVLEALANAVPVVLPAHGAFPELIADTQGGVLFEPENPRALADALRPLILDPNRAGAMGLAGQRVVRGRYDSANMAKATMALYRAVRDRFDSLRASDRTPLSPRTRGERGRG